MSAHDATGVAPLTPRLLTSHDIVQRVRRWSGQRRIGHTGTLDPMASGVLVLCLGQATRLVEYYQGHDKRYHAEVTLGSATDTYDAMGAITATRTVPPLTTEGIESVLDNFQGEILQQPPIYSALKQGGESLHRKARRGESVIIEPRPITIYRLQLLAFTPPNRLTLHIHCSAGAYIRSLAHDLGQALQTYGHLSLLRRETVGVFRLADAHSLATIEAQTQAEAFEDLLLPLGQGLSMPAIHLTPETMTRLGHGQVVPLPNPFLDNQVTLAQGIAPDGTLVGILQCLGKESGNGDGILWKAEKWFANQ
ncbi:MAG: tRNA pseudouridine(55) synthase TruB [Caldilineaceae bacterium]